MAGEAARDHGPLEASRNINYDLGAAVVRRTLEGERLAGRRRRAAASASTSPATSSTSALGYPAVTSPLAPDSTASASSAARAGRDGTDDPGTAGPATTAIDCDMTGGSSGGGWIVAPTLLSVTSYGYELELDSLYGPYMSTAAKSLYRQVRGKPKRKKAGKGSKGSKRPRGA